MYDEKQKIKSRTVFVSIIILITRVRSERRDYLLFEELRINQSQSLLVVEGKPSCVTVVSRPYGVPHIAQNIRIFHSFVAVDPFSPSRSRVDGQVCAVPNAMIVLVR